MAETNIFGVVLAGGKGTRMGNVEKPKQFMEIGRQADYDSYDREVCSLSGI